MARRPARLERAGALTPRDRMWAAMRSLNKFPLDSTGPLFSPAEVMALTGLHVDTVCTYFRGLAKAEPPYLELIDSDRPAGTPRRECFLYRLERDTGVDAPAVTSEGKPTASGVGNELMWNAMRTQKEFDCTDIALAASTAAHPVSLRTVKTYVTFLARAGYLAVFSKSKPGTQARYVFVRSRNSGPRAPLVTRDKSVIDGNTGHVVLAGKREALK